MSVAFTPNPSTSKVIATSTTSAKFADNAMAAGKVYRLAVTTASFVKQAAHATNPVAAGADGSFIVNPGETFFLHGSNGDTCAVTAAAGTGFASLVEVDPTR